MDFMPYEGAPQSDSTRLGRAVLGAIATAVVLLGGLTMLARPSVAGSAGLPGGVAGLPASASVNSVPQTQR